MKKEVAEYGDQVGMNRTAVGTIKLFYDKDDLRKAEHEFFSFSIK
jgi:hypothetical protein